MMLLRLTLATLTIVLPVNGAWAHVCSVHISAPVERLARRFDAAADDPSERVRSSASRARGASREEGTMTGGARSVHRGP